MATATGARTAVLPKTETQAAAATAPADRQETCPRRAIRRARDRTGRSIETRMRRPQNTRDAKPRTARQTSREQIAPIIRPEQPGLARQKACWDGRQGEVGKRAD